MSSLRDPLSCLQSLQCRSMGRAAITSLFFFFNDTATTEIYTLSLHDALPIWRRSATDAHRHHHRRLRRRQPGQAGADADRKSTRLNSSHLVISYAVFCLKKKKKQNTSTCELHHILQDSQSSVRPTLYLQRNSR